MGRIVISTNVTLDGVVQDPDGGDGQSFGGWFREFGGKDLEQWQAISFDEARASTALLLGRRTDAWFAERWLPRPGEWAERLNGMPKYIVSATIEETRWGTGTVLKGDVVTAVSKLKDELDGDIVVYASYQLGRALLEHDLVDELRLVVFPVVLGAGERLFDESIQRKPMRLMSSRMIGEGLVFLTYDLVREG